MADRPELHFQAMVRLTEVMHRQLPEPPEFDRRRYRADVLQRLQQRAETRGQGRRLTARWLPRPHFVSLLVIEVWTRKCGRLTLPRAGVHTSKLLYREK